jgi:hypothetical protein
MRLRGVLVMTIGVALVAATVVACSSGGASSSTPTIVPSTPPSANSVSAPTFTGPVTGGGGKAVLGPGGFDLSTVGYEQQEYFQSGTATAFTSATPLTSEGDWDMTAASTAPYTTRIVVRRPTDAAAFNGTVFVEWLNVSGGLDASPDWTYSHVELIRSGYAWVGVSAQSVGIVGGGSALGAALALKNADPVRYASLSHPGDAYSYDMYSQTGAGVWFQGDQILGGLHPERVIAIGESQSAFRLTSYVDGIAPLADIYDGYLIHSRGDVGATFGNDVTPLSPTFIRTDLHVPVLIFSSESDLPAKGVGLGYARARQPETDLFRSWEVAGTAHADSYLLGIGDADNGDGAGDAALFQAMLAPSAEIYGGIISCASPINTGPHTYVIRSAVVALDDWIRTGVPPAVRPRIEMRDDVTFARAGNGDVIGGIRTPQVDVPVATLSGIGQTGSSFCFLFGTTTPMPPASYMPQGKQAFIDSWDAALEDAMALGAIVPADAEHLRTTVANAKLGEIDNSKVGGP